MHILSLRYRKLAAVVVREQWLCADHHHRDLNFSRMLNNFVS